MTSAERKRADEQYFNDCKALLDPVLGGLGFWDAHVAQSLRNAVLLYSKPSWRLNVADDSEHTLLIHFEARRRNELRVEVHLEPYDRLVREIRANPENLVNELTRMSRLVAELRALLLAASTSHSANSKRLKPADFVAANIAIVKYEGDVPDHPELRQSVAFFAAVVDEVTPLIDRYLASQLGATMPSR